MTESKRPRRTFTPEFKHQLVQLYKNGKRKSEITKEYDIGYSLLDKWILQESNSGSFKEKDNLTPEQKELQKLRKNNQQLLMENDILKQAALILGRK
jgi:transposase